jgi:Spy/CpxP family protein refolding chaperone
MRALVCSTTLAALLALSPSGAVATAPSTNAAGQTTAAPKVCRWIDRTGSNQKERICLTRDQWKKVEQLLDE